MEKSTRESMVRTKAAVLPVPDWDCPIMLVGLRTGDEARTPPAREHARVAEHERQRALLDLRRLGEAHVVDALQQLLRAARGSARAPRAAGAGAHRPSSSNVLALNRGESGSSCWSARVTCTRARAVRACRSDLDAQRHAR
jgi:hypothetical protein